MSSEDALVIATDPEDDPRAFDLPLRPAGMTIHPTTGLLTWTPTAAQAGTHDVIVRVRDPHGGVFLHPYRLTVREPNSPPVITSTPPAQAIRGLPLEYAVRAQDAAGQELRFRLDTYPAGMSIDPDTGALRWTPGDAQLGDHPVTVAVTDDRGGVATQPFVLRVVATAANTPPQILAEPRTRIHLGGRYLYRADAVDPDFDPLTYQLAVAPAGMSVDPDGLVTWEPTAGQFGPNPVEVRVSDGRGGVAVKAFTIDVGTAVRNAPPSLRSDPPANALVGRAYDYDVHAEDPDGDPLGFVLVSGPRGLTVDPDRGTVRWLPAASQVGPHDVVLQVLDAQGASVTQRFRVTVRAANTPPGIRSAPPTEAAAGVLYTYPVLAADRDGDRLTYTLLTAPDGMTVDPTTGLVRWTPGADQIGPRPVVVVADDGLGGTATQAYTVAATAEPVNRPPSIDSTAPAVATTLVTYQYAVAATDPEGRPVEFLLLDAPAGALIDPATGLLRWTPTPGQVGAAGFTVAARDPGGATARQRFTVAVAADNAAPQFGPAPAPTVTEGETFRLDVRATDPDGDFLRYVLEQGPTGMTLDATAAGGNLLGGVSGRITWATAAGTAGTHRVRVRAVDPRGLSAVQEFDVTVAPDDRAPAVRLTLSPAAGRVGEPVSVFAAATDNLGVASLRLTVSGQPITLDPSGRATFVPTAAGVLDVVATARDAAGNTGTASATLAVIDPTVTGAPVVSLASPVDGAEVTAPTDVTGSVSDPDLALWTLSVGPAAGGAFTEIARGTTAVTDGTLGRFDPTLLPNDRYTLRLTATDTGGNTATAERTVGVTGNLKLGNFALSFTDLSVPVAGIPIQLTRTYDTLQANQAGDLGFGWRLEFRDARLRTTIPKTGLEAEGVFHGLRDGDKVYVTLPGGKREGFTFRPFRQFLLGQGFHHPRFVPDRGVTSRLTVPDARMRERGDEFIEVFHGLPFNPADPTFGGVYKLVTRDGVEYQIDALTGRLEAAADRNGNVLSFSDGGVVSSAGPAVTFARNARGRIVAAIDPAAHEVRYEYDAAGDLVAVTDREENTTRFGYRADRPHYLDRVIDPLNRTGVRTEYDEQGRLSKLIDAAGKEVRLGHDLASSVETVLDRLGSLTTYEYDARGNVLTEIDAEGGITRRTYDADGNVLTETVVLEDGTELTTTFTYDANGDALTQEDPLGNTTRYTYGPFNQVATTTDPLGNTTRNEHDARGNLLRTTDPSGGVTAFTYDAAGNQRSMIASGGTTTFEYDGAGRLRKQTDALGVGTTYTYDANGNERTRTTTLTTAAGVRALVTTTGYDNAGRVTAVTDAEGGVTRTEYNRAGQRTAVVDALGRRTEYVYDDRGLLTETIFPDGTPGDPTDNPQTRTEYDATSRMAARVDEGGRRMEVVYDRAGRLVATVYPDATPLDRTDSPRTRNEYDHAGRITAQIDERNNRTEYEYDRAGRQTVIRDALQGETVAAYDAAGRQVAVTDPLGHTTQFAYDAGGRQTETTFHDGTEVRNSYDDHGHLVGRTDQANRTIAYEYDPLGRLTAVVDAAGQRTEYGSDEAGNLVSQKDANQHVTRYEYDGMGRRTATILRLGQRSSTTYDRAGNVLLTTDFNNDTIRYQYDARNRLTAKHLPGGASVAFTYTPTGQRATVIDARGVTRHEYDERERLLSRTDPDGARISYSYDAAGNRTGLTTEVSGTTQTTVYTYDALNRLATVTDPADGVTRYTYDAAGNLRRTEFPNGVVETRDYDDLNRLLVLRNEGPGGVISQYTYQLGPTGLRTGVTEADGRSVAYIYDDLYRLTAETITDPAVGNRSITYTYDSVGNRLTRNDSAEGLASSTYDRNDRLLTGTLSGVITTYTYDDNGNQLTRTRGTTPPTIYQWDAENRLVAADTRGVVQYAAGRSGPDPLAVRPRSGRS